MKTLISLLAAVALCTPGAAFAAMPHFVGTGYKLAPDCRVPPDNGIYEFVGKDWTLTGCTPEEYWLASLDEAMRRWSDNSRPVYPAGSVILNTETGARYECPEWYTHGCVMWN